MAKKEQVAHGLSLTTWELHLSWESKSAGNLILIFVSFYNYLNYKSNINNTEIINLLLHYNTIILEMLKVCFIIRNLL